MSILCVKAQIWPKFAQVRQSMTTNTMLYCIVFMSFFEHILVPDKNKQATRKEQLMRFAIEAIKEWYDSRY